MKFYTKKWFDYVYKNWKKYISQYKIYYESERVDDNYKYTDELLMKEFNEYYKAKSFYISRYTYFKETFGNYEEISLLSYNDELNEYKEKLNNYVKDSLKKINNKYKYDKLENDLYLYALNKITNKFNDTILRNSFESSFSNDYNINKFLTSYSEYFKYRQSSKNKDDSFDYDIVFETSLHDGKIIDIEIKDKDIIITTISDSISNDQYRYTFTIQDANYNIIDLVQKKKIEEIKDSYIIELNCYNFEDLKYYIYLETNYMNTFNDKIEFWSDKILVSKKKMD